MFKSVTPSSLGIPVVISLQPLVEILNPAALSLLIDKGRLGGQRQGVCASGPMDSFAFNLCNSLLGLPDSIAIEVCGDGFELQSLVPMTICVTGGSGRCSVNGMAKPMWSVLSLKSNDILRIESNCSGYRYYVGFSAQLKSCEAYGSYSTVMRERVGGLLGNGMPLSLGDKIEGVLTTPSVNSLSCEQCLILKQLLKNVYRPRSISVIPGSQCEQFGKIAWHRLLSSEYQIDQHSNRMGIRLNGSSVSDKEVAMRSEGLTMGSIQIPANGQPIVLMSDRQTLGGYPKIANVAMVDLSYLSQQKPGATVTFTEVDLESARNQWRLREERKKKLRIPL